MMYLNSMYSMYHLKCKRINIKRNGGDLIGFLEKQKIIKSVEPGTLTKEEANKLELLLDRAHQEHLIHGDLMGNLIEWKEKKQKKISLIDPLGFRPGIHYLTTKKEGKSVEGVASERMFQNLVKRDQEALNQLH